VNEPCKYDRDLVAFLDGELELPESDRLGDHLASCPACRHAIDELRRCDAAIRDLRQPRTSPSFEADFWHRVAELGVTPRKHRRRWSLDFWTGWRPVLAGGLAVGLIAGVIMLSQRDPELAVAETFMAENREMLEDLELLGNLELLENWDAVQSLEEQG